MRGIKHVLLATSAVLLLAMAPAPRASAQVTFGINIGQPPTCPYGYYGYAPYNCAPYGYYSQDWFSNGAFIGAGRWYHGPSHFYGHVNRSFDPRYGYHGSYPDHGGYREPDDHWNGFHADHRGDPYGHYRQDDRSHGTDRDHYAQHDDHGHDDHGHH